MSYSDEYYKARKKRQNALSVQPNEVNNYSNLDSYSQGYYNAVSQQTAGSLGDGDRFMSNFWNSRVNDSIAKLNKYRDTINSGGYLSTDDLSAYEKALSYYKLGSNKLREIFKRNGYKVDDDETWNTTMSGMDDSFRSLSDYFSHWKDEAAFERDKSYRKTGTDFSELDEKELSKRIEEYKSKVANAIDKDTEAKAQKELNILNAQLEFKQKVNEDLKLLKDEKQKEAYLYYLGKDLEDGTSYADEYIASITSKDDSGMQFFQKGPFADGYQFGDVTKAIVGTFDDAFYTIGKGGFRFAEGVADWMGHGVANIADWLGNGTYADVLRESAAESFTDKFFAPVDAVTDKYSMLGKTSDAILEGVGQAGAMYAGGYVLGLAGLGLGPLGTTAATTGLSYLSGTGHGINEAYQAGATDAEAQIYGRISGFADAVSELLFGGLGKGANALGISKGLSSADDMLAKTVSKLFKGQLGKNLAEFGVKAGAEGLEEVIAGSMQALGKKMTYLSEEDIRDIFADENLLEQFVVGSITSGIMQAGDVKTSTKAGRDFITNLTKNEQIVVDTEFGNRLQEATKDGKKLSKKQQNKLYEDVISDMDKGLISTDTIEGALGGEAYKGYKSATEQEASLKKKQAALSKEIETLLDKPNPTIRDSERLAAARQELVTVEKSLSGLDVAGARSALSREIIGLTKNDSRLHESFNESARRGQDLQLDVEKFTGSAKTTAENLLKGGLNNTYKSRTLADLLTRISKDKNVVFDVSTAEKLAAAGLGVEGRTVNGVTTKDGIILNIESVKTLNSIVGHEITHTMEKAGHYDDLAKVMKEYAELKGDYQKKRSYLESVYAKTDANGNILKDENGNTVWIRDDVNIDAEVTADLVGDYLFTDEDFIRNLSAKHQNLFQKVYAEIKYLLKAATAGSTEARKLEKVKKMFDKAYRESTEAQKNTTEDGGVRYSISNFSDQVDAVNSGTFDRSNNLFVAKTPDIYGKIGLNSDLPMLTTASHIRKAQMPKDASKHQHGLTELQIKELPQKLEAPVIIMDSIDAARNSIIVVTDMLDPDGLPVIVSVKVDGKGQYNNVEIDSNFITSYYGRERFNNFMQANINANTLLYIDGKKATALATGPNTQWFGQLKNYSFDTIIRKTSANVNKNNKNTYSAAVATGDMATAQKLVDQAAEAAGYSVKAYHGTSNNFWTFEKGHKRTRGHLNLGDGFYFAADRSMAENYTSTSRVIDGYLKLENPYTIYGTRFYNDDLQKIAEQSGMEVTYENVSDVLQHMGYDGVIARNYDGNTNPVTQYVVFDSSQIKSADPVTYDDNGKVIPLSERFNSQKEDIRYSLSTPNEDIAPVGNFNIHGWDIADIDAPIRDDISVGNRLSEEEKATEADDKKGITEPPAAGEDTQKTKEDIPTATDDGLEAQLYRAERAMSDIFEKLKADGEDPALQHLTDEEWHDRVMRAADKYQSVYDEAKRLRAEIAENENQRFAALDESDIPPDRGPTQPEMEQDGQANVPLPTVEAKSLAHHVRSQLGFPQNRVPEVQDLISEYSKGNMEPWELYNQIKQNYGTYTDVYRDEDLAAIKSQLRTYRINVDGSIKGAFADYASDVLRKNFGRLIISKDGLPVDSAYQELQSLFPGYFPENVINPADQLARIIDVVNSDVETSRDLPIDEETIGNAVNSIILGVNDYRYRSKEAEANKFGKASFNQLWLESSKYMPPPKGGKVQEFGEGNNGQYEMYTAEETPERLTRAVLQKRIISNMKSVFEQNGMDFDEVLDNASRMGTLAINDTTPQRVNEKIFGWEEGHILNDLLFNKVALNEADKIKWHNEQVKKIRALAEKYHIKPRSDESRAAQMYAEGFWVNENNEIIPYGDAELAKDFPEVSVQNNIKGLAKDPIVRQIYDETFSLINASRAQNAYPEIPRLENYFLHFRAMSDTFSQLGLPFNPNDIKAKDLPTDINGRTADNKPGQPYFASSKHREGKRTSFDLLGGLENYLGGAGNQIFHISDIQNVRAVWGYLADRFGQAHGLENLDSLELEEQAEHIQKVYDGHLSNYARFLNEYANNLAGKTALMDRSVEGVIGRRGLQVLNTINTQAGRNQVGFSVSSALTNFIPAMEAVARLPKQDVLKAFIQMTSNVFSKDGFAENDPALIRRRGVDKFSKTLYEKASDAGYVLMSAVDNITSEFIVRAKYNELTRKGMSSEQAHIRAGEWAMRVMGDRSMGQMPLLYNSKTLGLFTKYQLEVRNVLDSMFYDTVQEAKDGAKGIENIAGRNAKTAAKITAKLFQISILNHIFGQTFEAIVGYNPTFDIISTISTLFGWDDEEDEKEAFGTNLEQAFQELLGDLPYTSLITDGGRIPMADALPISQLVTNQDEYGNPVAEGPMSWLTGRLKTVGEAAPYLLPGGYGQIKKTIKGLGMFSEEHPISGSYTDKGNLRFPVEKTFGNVLQAGLFGQYANKNARDYFDNERSPLKEKQIQEFIDVDLPIADYWKYREGLAKRDTLEEKFDYIADLDLPVAKKNILINNIVDRKEPVDMTGYEDYSGLDEFDFAIKNPGKYAIAEAIGGYKSYTKYTDAISNIQADKDKNGKSISGSRKKKVTAYIESLPLDYGTKIILHKSEYPSDDTYNMDIVEYLDSRDDISYDEMVTILKELGFTVNGQRISWD